MIVDLLQFKQGILAKIYPNKTMDARHPSKPEDEHASSVLWVILFLCGLFAFFLYLGGEPLPTVTNTKLFPLFESKKYDILEKKLDSESKVILQGDHKQGLGIFLDQYINERSDLITIRRRQYTAGRNLEYASDNLFSKGYHMIRSTAESIVNNDAHERVLWVIETVQALNHVDIEDINSFSLRYPHDKFLVTASVVPSRASKYFKVIEYEQIPKKFVSELLLKEHKLDKINAENLLNSFGGDLSHINELLQDAKAEANFVESYQGQTEELETLLATNTKQVKDFFDNMCKNGEVKAKKELDFIPSNNGLVRFHSGVYKWQSIRGLFAFSDKFDQTCNSDIVIDYVSPSSEKDDQSWVSSWTSNTQPTQQSQIVDEEEVAKEKKGTKEKAQKVKQTQPKKQPKKAKQTKTKTEKSGKKEKKQAKAQKVEVKVVKGDSHKSSKKR